MQRIAHYGTQADKWPTRRLSIKAHAAGVRIIGSAGWYGHNADAIRGDLVLGRSGGSLGCGSSSGKSENDDESADGKLHVVMTFLCLSGLKSLIMSD